MARQAPLGDRLSGQGRQRPRRSARDLHIAPHRRSAVARRFGALSLAVAALRAAAPARHQDRARRQPGRHRGLAGARRRRVPLIAVEFRLPRRRRAGPGRQGRARQHDGRDCSTKAPASSTPRPSRSGWSARRSSCSFAPAATTSAARCARSRRTGRGLRPAAARAERAALRCRRGRAHPRPDDRRGCSAQSTSPNDIASRNWWATAFPGHPYGRPVNGTLEIGAAHHRRRHARLCAPRARARHAQDRRSSATSTPTTAGRLIDRAFGALPAKAELHADPRRRRMQGLGRAHRRRSRRAAGGGDVRRPGHRPQRSRLHGRPIIVNHILGGGSFTSRLYREVREKRGLAYGVYASLSGSSTRAVLIGAHRDARRRDRARRSR